MIQGEPPMTPASVSHTGARVLAPTTATFSFPLLDTDIKWGKWGLEAHKSQSLAFGAFLAVPLLYFGLLWRSEVGEGEEGGERSQALLITHRKTPVRVSDGPLLPLAQVACLGPASWSEAKLPEGKGRCGATAQGPQRVNAHSVLSPPEHGPSPLSVPSPPTHQDGPCRLQIKSAH